MHTRNIKHTWWRIISPCLIASTMLFTAGIYRLLKFGFNDRWELFCAIAFGILLLLLLVIDVILKVWFELNNFQLWFVEATVVLGILPFFQLIVS